MATAAVRQTTTAADTQTTSRSATTASATVRHTAAGPTQRDAIRVGWAVRDRAGQVVVIYEGATAQAVAEEWASDRRYTVEAVTL